MAPRLACRCRGVLSPTAIIEIQRTSRADIRVSSRLVSAVSWFGQLNLIPQPLFPVGYAIGKDHANALVQEKASLRWRADMQMEEVAESVTSARVLPFRAFVGGEKGPADDLGTAGKDRTRYVCSGDWEART